MNVDHSPALEEPVILFEILENFKNGNHNANEMTPNPSNEVS